MVDFTSLDNIKNTGRVGSTIDDRLLKLLIPACSEFIRNYTSDDLPIADKNGVFPSFTEYRDGKCQRTIALFYIPIQSVQSLTINSTIIPLASDPTQPGYLFSSERVSVNGWLFSDGFQNIKVVYTAGYTSVPPDIEQACREMILEKYKRMTDRIGQKSASLAGQTVTFTDNDVTPNVKGLLSPYRRVFLSGGPG